MASVVVDIPPPERGFAQGGNHPAPVQPVPKPAPAPVPPTPAPVPTPQQDLLELAAVVNYLQAHGVSNGLVAQVVAAVLAFKPGA